MITALDTNVIINLWDRDPVVNTFAQTALDDALMLGTLVVGAPVFSELMAAPRRTEAFVNAFFEDTSLGIEFDLSEAIWRAAGQAFQAYAARRRKQQRDPGPRRILADFLIGAHASYRGYRLLTLDDHFYKSAFNRMEVITF